MTQPVEEMATAALLDGRYQLGACIGQGGMARVFRAEDLQLGRTVAIKMLRGDADAHATPERARMEMALLASLNHPSLVTLFDASIVPGKPEYLVMELVDGPSLAGELAKGPMAAGEVAAIAAELAAALHVVHDAGIVHRDIKPSNVLLAPTSLPGRRHRAKLADFGVAYLADSTRLTTPGLIIGTAAYLAPEQVRGEPAGGPADIYSLGLMLLEALTGHRAFPHASGIGAVMTRLIEEPVIPDWMGRDWAELLQDMTATDPAARPTALEVLDRVAGLPVSVAPAPVSTAAVEGHPPETVPLALPAGLPAAAAVSGDAPASAPVDTPPQTGDPATAAVAPMPRRRGRRAAVLLPLAAAGALLFLQVGLWVGGMHLQSGVAPAVGPTPAPSVSSVQEAVTEDEVEPILPAGDVRQSTPSDPAEDATAAAREAEKAAREAEKAAEQAAQNEQKAAEQAARDAQKAAEQAARDAAKEQAAQQRAADKAARDAQKPGKTP
ncbi:hypothetical protein MSA03_07400 [Microbacterium saccharophilum]|nr:serine/threonine-protein kinase [Microbacterium saccharophilum]GEP47232.1 hypothetical protein MSA03_07400 [Microbacterium saccharophilum]